MCHKSTGPAFRSASQKKLRGDRTNIEVGNDLKTPLLARLSVSPINAAMIAKLTSSTLSHHPQNTYHDFI